MRALVWIASLTFLPACTGGSDSPPSYSAVSNAATVSTSGAMDVPANVTVALTPELIAQAEAMAANSRALDAICETLPIDASLRSRRPHDTGCPRDSAEANGAVSEAQP